MPGIRNILIGAVIAIAGVLVTRDFFAIPTDDYLVVAYGAILLGGLLFVTGLIQLISGFLNRSDGNANIHADPSVRAILQAMLATSIADGELDDTEATAIAEIYVQIFGGNMQATWIQDTAKSMLEDGSDIGDALKDKEHLIEDSMKPLILRAAYFVAAADGGIDENEKNTLMTIADALRMEQSETDSVFEELRQLAT